MNSLYNVCHILEEPVCRLHNENKQINNKSSSLVFHIFFTYSPHIPLKIVSKKASHTVINETFSLLFVGRHLTRYSLNPALHPWLCSWNWDKKYALWAPFFPNHLSYVKVYSLENPLKINWIQLKYCSYYSNQPV